MISAFATCLRLFWQTTICCCLLLSGCIRQASEEVVVYAALDTEFSQPILDKFSAETGIRVLAKFDVESTKTVGLTNALIAEADRPRCDLFWNNEILNTLRLRQRKLLQPYDSPMKSRYPAEFRAADNSWFGFAARARVLIVNTERLPDPDTWPSSIRDLSDPKWKDQAAMAKPLFGTTASHATILFHVWGTEKATQFFTQVAGNVAIMSGNKQVALAVARGQLAWGITDTDDAIIELEKGRPVQIVYPDQAEDALGTLFIPNTVSIIRGGPHTAAAKQLLDYLLRAEVEAALAAGPSAQIPLGTDSQLSKRVETPQTVRPMSIDFEKAVQQWEHAAPILRDLFHRN